MFGHLKNGKFSITMILASLPLAEEVKKKKKRLKIRNSKSGIECKLNTHSNVELRKLDLCSSGK